MAMKKSIKVLVSSVGVLLSATGCLYVETDTFYNNSGQELSIVAQYPGTNVVMIVKDGGSIQFYSPYIEVHHKADTWHYETKPMVSRFHEYRRGSGNEILVNLQIQPDGTIYVMAPNASGIVTDFPPQPTGFPLKPK
jgi:hypothetical protein